MQPQAALRTSTTSWRADVVRVATADGEQEEQQRRQQQAGPSTRRVGAAHGLRILSGAPRARIEFPDARVVLTLPRVWGMEFSSRLGLAAGFDKDAEILEGLPELGFGFAEIDLMTV